MSLPPFSNLIAFDAAARHGTFTRAAEELNVTQPAVSRRVAALESDLGVLLFDRRTKPLRLTSTGQTLFDILRSGLSRLESAIVEIRAARAHQGMTISTLSGFAAFWLIPRLPALQAAFPEHNLRILSSDQTDDRMSGDLQIRFGDGHWPNMESVKILGEEVFAVCSPSYLHGHPVPMSLSHLKTAKLLHHVDLAGRWYGWAAWFAALGSPLRRQPRTLDFDSYSLLANAALAGHGIALCWAGLLDEFLDSGALVRVTKESVRSARGYFVTHQTSVPADSVVRDVARWLQIAAARPVCEMASAISSRLYFKRQAVQS